MHINGVIPILGINRLNFNIKLYTMFVAHKRRTVMKYPYRLMSDLFLHTFNTKILTNITPKANNTSSGFTIPLNHIIIDKTAEAYTPGAPPTA